MKKELFQMIPLSLGVGLFFALPGCGPNVPEEHGRIGGSESSHSNSEGAHGDHDASRVEEVHKASQVTITANQITLAEIETKPATVGAIYNELKLTGEVTLNQDRVTHIVPRVPGVVREVLKTLGAQVDRGEVLAILESRELADAKAEYLASRERLSLANAIFTREEALWQKQISSEQEYLDAKRVLAETRIELRSSEQKLHALGVSESYLRTLPEQSDQSFTHFEMTAPFAGIVIEKHITLGEKLDDEENVFTIADLNTVWVIGNVYEKDISRVAAGQWAKVSVKSYLDSLFRGQVGWIGSTLEEETRSLNIRVEVANRGHMLKPGMFARLALEIEEKQNTLIVPPSALLSQGVETILFVEEGPGHFERRVVEVGNRSATAVEILDGVGAGEKVVTNGAFILKSELEKEGFEAGHAH